MKIMITTPINFNQKTSLNYTNKTLVPKIKTHSQPIQDTVSFGSLHNFGEVVAGKLYRGAQPHIDDFKELKEKGIKFVIDLDLCNAPKEREIVKSLGMEYIPVKLVDTFAGIDKYLNQFEELATKIDELSKEGAVFVHCEKGHSRTGITIAAYQHFIQKMTDNEIMDDAKKYNSYDDVKPILPLIN